jgi:hypothetical protein
VVHTSNAGNAELSPKRRICREAPPPTLVVNRVGARLRVRRSMARIHSSPATSPPRSKRPGTAAGPFCSFKAASTSAAVIAGVRRRDRQLDRGNADSLQTSKTRSVIVTCGLPVCRRRTDSSCRSTTSSNSLRSSERRTVALRLEPAHDLGPARAVSPSAVHEHDRRLRLVALCRRRRAVAQPRSRWRRRPESERKEPRKAAALSGDANGGGRPSNSR